MIDCVRVVLNRIGQGVVQKAGHKTEDDIHKGSNAHGHHHIFGDRLLDFQPFLRRRKEHVIRHLQRNGQKGTDTGQRKQ